MLVAEGEQGSSGRMGLWRFRAAALLDYAYSGDAGMATVSDREQRRERLRTGDHVLQAALVRIAGWPLVGLPARSCALQCRGRFRRAARVIRALIGPD